MTTSDTPQPGSPPAPLHERGQLTFLPGPAPDSAPPPEADTELAETLRDLLGLDAAGVRYLVGDGSAWRLAATPWRPSESMPYRLHTVEAALAQFDLQLDAVEARIQALAGLHEELRRRRHEVATKRLSGG